jgi:hypothetical protein
MAIALDPQAKARLRASAITHHLDGLLIPIEVWPNIGTAATALSADEIGFDIRQRTRAPA